MSTQDAPEKVDAYSDLGGNLPPTREDYIFGQLAMGNDQVGQLRTDMVFDDPDDEELFRKLSNANYWAPFAGSLNKIRSTLGEVNQKVIALGREIDERGELLENEGKDPKKDLQYVTQALQIRHWRTIEGAARSNPRVASTLDGR